MSFWANYVLLKERDGIERAVTLALIESKKGLALRQQIEQELAQMNQQ